MKILHIGDIAFISYSLCQELQSRGIETTLLSKKKLDFNQTKNKNWILSSKNKIDELKLCNVDLKTFDVIHSHYLLNLGSIALAVQNPKKPIILHAHGCDTRPISFIHKLVQRFVASKAKVLLYSTPDLKKNMEWFKGEKIYLPNPIDIPSDKPETKKHKNKILIFTTLYKIKEIEKIFLEVENLNFNFDIIDDGPDADYYKGIAPANISFIKPFKKDDVNQELLKYQLIIGGSQDGTIRVCELESMALGIPTLFPFAYNDSYAEPLPMPETNEENILKCFGDYDLGEKQKIWVSKYHATEISVNKLLNIYSKYQ
ncbi:MAG: hypothetical protein P9X22_04160 [Candidatus Zapsychrus exili]|nr:hypothetical protein [Candidatus Zapsychrus exili]